MLTPWGERLDPDAPLPEYPRPQLVRGDWQNLNGRWDCTFTPYAEFDPLAVDDPTRPPRRWPDRIVVPFSPEMPLSGVGRTLQHDQLLWYRRTFDLPRALQRGERVLVHFGAVDQTCRVAVDGVEVGGHTGGYLPFTFDVTDALSTAGDAHELVVAVRDVTDAAWLTRGKQSRARGGIWYTPQSGIWQTVWLEIVPATHISHLDLVPHLDTGELEITVHVAMPAPAPATPAGGTAASPGVTVASPGVTSASPGGTAAPDVARVRIDAAGTTVASTVLTPGEPTRIALPAPVRTWSPDDPFLYDIEVRLGADTVHSYVGMRSFGIGRDAQGHPRLLLNGAPHLPVGLLDQGYWPDGGYTAPSDAALEYDVRLAKDMGFTMLRKHIKVEPLRWYHHCDRLGIIVWQDAVNGGGRYRPLTITAPALTPVRFDDGDHERFAREDAGGRSRFESELDDMIAHLRAVPSIGLWAPFNEGWGQFDAARIAAHVAELDPTRPIDHASGWHDQGAGDLQSLHVYFRRFRVPRRRDDRVLALTEYGGYSLAVPGRTWGRKTFGYRTYRTQAALRRAFERLHDEEIAPAIARGLGAIVYTQLSDVEDEVNGLVSYDRRFIKIPIEAVRAVTDRLRAAAGDPA